MLDLANLMQSMSLNVTEDPQLSGFHISACIINNNHTDLVLAEFSNRWFIIATQHERAGTLLRVLIDQPEVDAILEGNSPVYTSETLFGADCVEQLAVARFLAEQLGLTKTLMVFLNLKDYSVQTVHSLLTALQESRKNVSK